MHDYLFWNRKVFFLLCEVKSKQINPLCWTNQALALETSFPRIGPIIKSAALNFSVFIKAVTSSIERAQVFNEIKSQKLIVTKNLPTWLLQLSQNTLPIHYS